MLEPLFKQAQSKGIERLNFFMDPSTDFIAIVALTKTAYRHAIGGCRFIEYPCLEAAVEDVIALAQMMRYKAAMLNLPYGGGKSVLIKPKSEINRAAYLKKFSDFINTLQGAYIVAADSGTTAEDMEVLSKTTEHVLCTTEQERKREMSTSAATALGVFISIETLVAYQFRKNGLKNIHIAVQGVGEVGHHLVSDFIDRGAKVTISDVNQEKLSRFQDHPNVNVVQPEAIYQVDCDIFCPCALGGVLNASTIKQLRANVVAGSANNQLKTSADGIALWKRNILYVPDFMINGGGLLNAVGIREQQSKADILEKINDMPRHIIEILRASEEQNMAPSVTAEIVAKSRLAES